MFWMIEKIKKPSAGKRIDGKVDCAKSAYDLPRRANNLLYNNLTIIQSFNMIAEFYRLGADLASEKSGFFEDFLAFATTRVLAKACGRKNFEKNRKILAFSR